MKKLLILLLFFALKAQGQITITPFSGPLTTTSNASAFGVSDATFTAGKLYLFVALTTGADNNGTMTSTSLTWDQIVGTGDATRRIQVFRCMPTSTVTLEDVSLGSFGGLGTTGYTLVLYEITGVLTTGSNGANAIVNSESNSATGVANPSITIDPISNPNNAVILFFTSNANPFGGTPKAGWTEAFDEGFADPVNGSYIMYRIATTDNNPTVTAAAADWRNFTLELAAAPIGRRRIILDYFWLIFSTSFFWFKRKTKTVL